MAKKFETECQKEALRKYGKRYADLTDEQVSEISTLVAKRLPKETREAFTKVTIVVRGGVVQEVYSDNPNIELSLLDFDSEDEFVNHALEAELQKTQEEQNQIF